MAPTQAGRRRLRKGRRAARRRRETTESTPLHWHRHRTYSGNKPRHHVGGARTSRPHPPDHTPNTCTLTFFHHVIGNYVSGSGLFAFGEELAQNLVMMNRDSGFCELTTCFSVYRALPRTYTRQDTRGEIAAGAEQRQLTAPRSGRLEELLPCEFPSVTSQHLT